MAEAVRRSRIVFLKLMGKLFASVLTLFGVLSSCDVREIMVAYGPPEGLLFSGQVVSSSDSSAIPGIQLRLSSPDSSVVYGTSNSLEDGQFNLSVGYQYFPWPKSVLVNVTDTDGELNGSFASKDTLIFPDRDEEYQEFQIDFLLDKE